MVSCMVLALVRLAWPLMFSAATVWPARLVMGAAMDTRPSSSSWFTSDQPCRRTCAILAVSSFTSVTVCLVRAVKSEAARHAMSSASGNADNSMRPIEVQ